MESLRGLSLNTKEICIDAEKVYNVVLAVDFTDKEQAREFANTLSWQAQVLTQKKAETVMPFSAD